MTKFVPLAEGTGDVLRGSRIISSVPSLAAFTDLLLRRIGFAGGGETAGPESRPSPGPVGVGSVGFAVTAARSTDRTTAARRGARPPPARAVPARTIAARRGRRAG